MNRKVLSAMLIELLTIVFYLIIVFIMPFTHNNIFILNTIIVLCGLLAISIIINCFIIKYAKKNEVMFIIPMIKYSTIIAILLIISSIIFIISEVVPMWMQVVVYLIYLGIYCGLIISVSSIKNKSVNRLEEVKSLTNLKSEWIVRLNIINKKSDNIDLKSNLESLISILQHGDSMGKPQLIEIEKKISNEIAIIEELINKGKIDGAIIECSVLNALLIERRELTSLYN